MNFVGIFFYIILIKNILKNKIILLYGFLVFFIKNKKGLICVV
jgi:hypothetical protein